MENVYAWLAILMMAQIIYASNAIIVGKKINLNHNFPYLALNAQIKILRIVLNAISQISVKKNLMGIYMEKMQFDDGSNNLCL